MAVSISDQLTGTANWLSVETPTELWSPSCLLITDVATTQNDQEAGSATFSLVAGTDPWRQNTQMSALR